MEVLTAPDGEGLELHHLDPGRGDSPRVLMLHGLEGSRESHYVGGFISQAQQRGWGATLLVFRGCGSQPNSARRFYHSGETTDLDFVFRTIRERWRSSPFLLTGVSLGGNVLLKWLGEKGASAEAAIHGAAAVSVPYDLEAGARRISEGRFRIYDRSFLSSLRRKALAKLERIPALLERERLKRAQTVFQFDDCVTAPVHGFKDAIDYYSKSSSIRFLGDIRVPTLLLSASDDPFLPREVLDRVRQEVGRNPRLDPEFHEHGGHVGFIEGAWPWSPRYFAERRVFEFFDQTLAQIG